MITAQQLPLPPVGRSSVLASWVIVWLVAFGSAGLETSDASPTGDRSATSLTAIAETTVAPLATPMDNPVIIGDVVLADDATKADDQPKAQDPSKTEDLSKVEDLSKAEDLPRAEDLPKTADLTKAADASATEDAAKTAENTATDSAPSPAQEPSVKLASADPTEVLPEETPSVQSAIPDAPAPVAAYPRPTVGTVEVLDECFVVDACVDRYLWALYQRTPKEDSIKVPEQRQVTVRRRGKTVTVTRTFSKQVDEDFSWKDPVAADKAGMALKDYVIGGMDRTFKLKLFRTLLAAEAAGLSPGITSAFRDDYRQMIASGLKAASNRSYHGGSLRGGYGHGLAADIVSTKGATRDQRWMSSEALWKWVDANGKTLGIGRPYLGHDPPHVGPIDGPEYVSRRGGATTEHAAVQTKQHASKKLAARKTHKPAQVAQAKTRSKVAAHDERSAPKRPKTSARSSKVRTG
jgi:hypothetical protein